MMRICISVLLLALCAGSASAAELLRIEVVTEQVIGLVLRDGKAAQETRGNGANGKILSLGKLDLETAMRPQSWQVEAGGGKSVPVKSVGRKSKGVAFARVAQWDIAHADGHWIYLLLDKPLPPAGACSVRSDLLGAQPVSFDPGSSASPALQVNQIGYLPMMPKFAYASHWLGSAGDLDLSPFAERGFQVVDSKSGTVLLKGKPELRLGKDREEGADGVNLRSADLWQCDFSALNKPGRYVIHWPGVGRSRPFEIGPTVYTPAYRTAMAGLFHQRCGCAIEAAHSDWPRPRCHHGKVALTSHRFIDASNAFEQLPEAVTGEKRELFGGYHDAGDWDRHSAHLSIADALLFVFEAAPKAFRDGGLRIPEAGNGVPDIVDEARWGVDFFLRMQREDGGVMAGIETPGHPKFGETSWTDSFPLYAYAADPQASYRFAASAASLSRAYQRLRMEGLAARYLKAAERAWVWARADPQEKDFGDERIHAAASLFAATGGDEYHEVFKRYLKVKGMTSMLEEYENYDQRWAVWIYATCDQAAADAGARKVLAKASANYARWLSIDTASKRGRRQGYNWWKPFGHGSLTMPDNLALIAAHRTGGGEEFLRQMTLNCDAPFGANQLGISWMSGIGSRPVSALLHIDSWYDENAQPVPGIVPYGPRRWESEPGWTHGFGMRTLWPEGGSWPREELWTSNYMSPASAEFTVWETCAPSAAALAYLHAVGAR